MKILRLIVWSFLLLIILPLGIGASVVASNGWPRSYSQADWSSAGIAPDPYASREAIVQVYAARTGRWKGIFAVHTWIAVKPANAGAFDRYEVVGWGRPLRRNSYPVDGNWYSNRPQVILDVRGAEAAALIPRIEQAIARYPYRNYGQYRIWPGPNSNSFVAWIARSVPELGLEMPATAVGKDFMGTGLQAGRAPSGTGWQASIGGFMGATLARREGFELNFLGVTVGVDPQDLAIKLPSLGKIGPGSAALAGSQ